MLDRSAVILAIFQRHARSREARLQVEIARLSYWAPRVREQSGGKDRQGGGIGGRGAGESHLELDRRKLRDRIAELRAEIKAIEHEAGVRRQRREEQNKVALVGYTNAGKSSLMRALTGSGVMVADRLFATLDTTVRALQPETRPRVLVSDTVGFIKKLPHELVASFRSTLDEARDAELLLHVVDAADPAFPAQIEVTRAVLDDIGAQGPRLLLLNKIDRVDAARREALRAEYPDALLLSAKDPEDVARLHGRIRDFFERDMVEAELSGPVCAAEARRGDPRELPRALRSARRARHAAAAARAARSARAPAGGGLTSGPASDARARRRGRGLPAPASLPRLPALGRARHRSRRREPAGRARARGRARAAARDLGRAPGLPASRALVRARPRQLAEARHLPGGLAPHRRHSRGVACTIRSSTASRRRCGARCARPRRRPTPSARTAARCAASRSSSSARASARRSCWWATPASPRRSSRSRARSRSCSRTISTACGGTGIPSAPT